MSCVLVEGQKCDVRGSLSPTPDRYTGRCSCKVYYSLSPGVIADTCICSVSQLFATLHWHWSKTDPNKLIQKWQHKAHITMCCLLANNFEYTNRRACFNMLPQSASLPLFVGYPVPHLIHGSMSTSIMASWSGLCGTPTCDQQTDIHKDRQTVLLHLYW